MKRRPIILPLPVNQYVSVSVGKRVFSKTAYRNFLKLLTTLGSIKDKKPTEKVQVESWFCACNFIVCQLLSCYVRISKWIYTLYFANLHSLVSLFHLWSNWLWVRIPLLSLNSISYILKVQIINHVILDGRSHITGFYSVATCFFVFDFVNVVPRLRFLIINIWNYNISIVCFNWLL